MGDIIWLYKGKPIRNLDCYFLEDGACIEEFDTDDGTSCLARISRIIRRM